MQARRAPARAGLCWGLALLAGCGPHPAARPRPAGPPTAIGAEADDRTGAVDSVPIPAGQQESVDDLLQGRVPGLHVLHLANGDIALRIRGTNSLLEEGDPLVIIDGLAVMPGNLTWAFRGLKPHEIQDIRVLKDVSSTSVYGSAGAHGVILITTKHDR